MSANDLDIEAAIDCEAGRVHQERRSRYLLVVGSRVQVICERDVSVTEGMARYAKVQIIPES